MFSQILVGTRKTFVIALADFGTQTEKGCPPLAYNIADVCCNSHVQENMLSSNRFTSMQGKDISWFSEFTVSLQNFRVSL